ncbi:MAG: putative lipid II flippase FtsW [Candidatus Nanopelagicales bacterium]
MSFSDPYRRRRRSSEATATEPSPISVTDSDSKRSSASQTDRPRVERRKLFSLGKAMKHPLADYGFLLGAVMVLIVVGLIMVLSASTVFSFRSTGSSYTLFIRQAMFAVLGVIAMFVLSRMPVNFFRRMATPALIASVIALLLVLVPGIGVSVNGQRNWISLGGPFRLQPSEFAKFALILWAADLLCRRRDKVDGWKSLLMPLAPVAGAVVFLILMEGDLGTTLVIMPIVAAILLVAGAPMKLFAWMGAAVLALIGLMSVTTPYRLQRFATWLDPAGDPTGAGWQVIHGQYALATGGWWGVGLGASREKWGFLPEAQTDFILAVIGEELGLVGTISVLTLFAVVAIVIAQIAMRTGDEFVRLAATGVGIWVVMQALINIGAVLGALPITGLPLPLVSYGGSSLTFTLMAVGMLLAFARAQPKAQAFLDERASAKKGRRKRTGDSSKLRRRRRTPPADDHAEGASTRNGRTSPGRTQGDPRSTDVPAKNSRGRRSEKQAAKSRASTSRKASSRSSRKPRRPAEDQQR